jgi:hypothetical protein
LKTQNGWVTVDEYSCGLQSHDLLKRFLQSNVDAKIWS